MQNIGSGAPNVNNEILTELAALANRWIGTTRHVARALIEAWKASPDGRILASAQQLADDVGVQRAAVLRALRRLMGEGMIGRIGARCSSTYRFLVGGSAATLPAAVDPPVEVSAEESPAPPRPLSRVETDISYAVRNARDEALHGPAKVSEWPRAKRPGELVAGGFSSVERARRVCLWVLAFAEANGEWWETIANYLGRSYVSAERRRPGGRAVLAGCPMDWIAFDGGRGVLTDVGLAYERRRRLERQRASARQVHDEELAEAVEACAALLGELEGAP